jgi:hypothetical protein
VWAAQDITSIGQTDFLARRPRASAHGLPSQAEAFSLTLLHAHASAGEGLPFGRDDTTAMRKN